MVGEIDRRQEMLRSISETEIHVIKHPSLSQEEFGDLMENLKNLMTLASTLFAIAEQVANRFFISFDYITQCAIAASLYLRFYVLDSLG